MDLKKLLEGVERAARHAGKIMLDEEGTPIESCPHPQQELHVDLGMQPAQFDILRCRA